MAAPILYGLLIALGLGAWLAGKKRTVHVNSDCHEEFLTLNDNLQVTKSKLRKLKKGRKAIQNKIKEYFRNLDGYTIPKFYIQGSSQVGTLIRNKKDFCDFDIGIYFFTKPPHKYETIQKHIKNALLGHTAGKISLLEKCVRINYSGDFHMDMPIYFAEQENFHLGSKGNNWEVCDSKVFKDWVLTRTNESPQITRLIRYFKAWSDNHRHKLPSGLAFTIWTIEHVECDERDDIAFIQTAAKLLKNLKEKHWSTAGWTCYMPVEPRDNVIDHLREDQKLNFRRALEELIKEGVEALSYEDKSEALKKWKKIFGKRFSWPLHDESLGV